MSDTMLRLVADNGYAVAACDATQAVQTIATDQHKLTGKPRDAMAGAIVGSLLLATRLKGVGMLNLEYESDGVLSYFRVDAIGLGSVRALVPRMYPKHVLAGNGVDRLLGDGKLAITKQLESRGGKPASLIALR